MNDKEQLIESLDKHKEIYQEIDGYWYFWQSSQGFLTSHNLKLIADELDKRNAIVDSFFHKKTPQFVKSVRV